MIASVQQVQDAEERLFALGCEAEPLMDRAGEGIARAIREFFPGGGTAVVFAGPGHNGGDALVAARHLAEAGWGIELELVGRENFKPLTEKKLTELGAIGAVRKSGQKVVIDGLLGIGARGPLRGEIGAAAARINGLREEKFARTVAVDLPSGIDGDSGEPHPGAVVADLTLTISVVKQGLLADAAINHVGRLGLIPLDEIAEQLGDGDRDAELVEPRDLTQLLPWRNFDTHKGGAGRVGIVAGSRGMSGAAVLCSAAAVRGGAGLVTLFVPEEIYPLVAASVIPEVMVQPVASYDEVAGANLDALAIGPGLGRGRAEEVQRLIEATPLPCVVDADALNAIAAAGCDVLQRCQEPRLLTPHPGEMERLFPAGDCDRRAWAEAFCEKFPQQALLLKGARTIVKQSGQAAAFNPTGHPGMASGGQGDLLTGLCTALVAQGQSVYDAARIASWLAGRAAELALGEQSEESYRPSDAIDQLGAAFASLRREANAAG